MAHVLLGNPAIEKAHVINALAAYEKSALEKEKARLAVSMLQIVREDVRINELTIPFRNWL
jgi:hypothetical protein